MNKERTILIVGHLVYLVVLIVIWINYQNYLLASYCLVAALFCCVSLMSSLFSLKQRGFIKIAVEKSLTLLLIVPLLYFPYEYAYVSIFNN